ncbi:ligand-binding sensor domain-containing protein [Salegentibacter holothuriorum]|uniref:ligand-binding sensor domain-containing protein n=1 Tax=Salegentibacter holothuriorum TaxID=241145 RepID=UPI0015909247|nr:two-component regulator propeller domain-containing protein [Salegentibacter holothuriorum]
MQFKHLDMSDGFSDNRINRVVQDNNGIIWTATRFGINRYDGEKVSKYALANTKVIYDLKVIGVDGILVATDKGLYSYHKESDRFENYNAEKEESTKSIFTQNIFSISNSNSQNFWIGGSAGNFHYVREDQKNYSFNALDLNASFPNTNIVSIFENQDGGLWLGTSNGEVWNFNLKTKKITPLNGLDNASAINDILVDSLNQLWVASYGNGLYKYDLKSDSLVHYKANAKNGESINNNIVLDLYEGNKQRIFIGTDGGGINLYDPEKNRFTYFKQKSGEWGLSDNSILCFGKGMHNMIFAGTVHGGISYFKDHTNVYNVSPRQLGFGTDKQSSQILEDTEANLWITAGRNGLRKYNTGTGNVEIFIDDKENNSDLGGDIVLSMEEDNKGRIWIGTLRGGLNVYDRNLKKFLIFPEKKNLRSIYVIEKGPNDNIWVGTANGIIVFNEQLDIVKRVNTLTCEGLSDNRITSIYRDAKDEMWVGTENGLNILSGKGKFLRNFSFSKDDIKSLSGNHILSINEGPDLSVYVGTYGFGLNRYSRRGDNFERIGEQEGLQGKIVRGILIDKQKNIWLSTNLGLSRIKDSIIRNFGIQEGIPPFHGGKASLSKSGRIYFAGNEGLSYFKPESLEQDIPKPLVFFTSFKIVEEEGSREINPAVFLNNQESDILKLQPGYSLFTVNFSSSNYFDLEDTEYFYKLEGLNNQWHSLNKRKSLTFSNLAPGDYTLHIAARNDTGELSQQEANIQIKVLPSFFQRKVIQALMLLLIGLMIFFLVRWRNRNIIKQRDKFKKIVAIRTKEVEKEKDRAYKNELELLETERQNELLKQKRLSDELNFKTEELTNSTLRTVHKNNLLVEIKENFIAEGKKDSQNKEFFKNIVEKIEDSLTIDTEWKQFYSIFNQVHAGFIPSLKEEAPSLTDRELRLCALIKLNFPSQQIATLFGISLNSIKVARHRLRKKLNMEEGSSFEDFFEAKGL